jgi:hypothetical protein
MLASSFKFHERHIVILPGSAAILLLSGCYPTNDLIHHGEDQSYYLRGRFFVPIMEQR